jgi:ubiquinone biosynthesis protein COQ9
MAAGKICVLQKKQPLSNLPELHQLSSPKTAYAFLDSLFESSSSLESTLGEVSLFSNYITKSWKGIIKSSGIF